MYSPEFMRYLIGYQDCKTENKSVRNVHVKYFRFSLKDRILASVSLLNRN